MGSHIQFSCLLFDSLKLIVIILHKNALYFASSKFTPHLLLVEIIYLGTYLPYLHRTIKHLISRKTWINWIYVPIWYHKAAKSYWSTDLTQNEHNAVNNKCIDICWVPTVQSVFGTCTFSLFFCTPPYILLHFNRYWGPKVQAFYPLCHEFSNCIVGLA